MARILLVATGCLAFSLICEAAAGALTNEEILQNLSLADSFNYFEVASLIEQLQGHEYDGLKELNRIQEEPDGCRKSPAKMVRVDEFPPKPRAVLRYAKAVVFRHSTKCRMQYIDSMLELKERVPLQVERKLRRLLSHEKLYGFDRRLVESLSPSDVHEVVGRYLLNRAQTSSSRQDEMERLQKECATLSSGDAAKLEESFALEYKMNLGDDLLEQWSGTIAFCRKLNEVFPANL